MHVFLDVFVACAVLVAACGRELDPAACAARFDVQRDKIIRTEESREMGARYLSELDVGSRHECRRLCCETDSCDVFVYEEKSPGSCYLFNCGPPEDFRCKFTAHGNFSSGVLALSRRLAELEDQERLARPPPAAAPAAPLAPQPHAHHPAPQTTTTTTTPPPPPIRHAATASNPPLPAATPSHTTPPPKKRCSRYQWECHTGGECIAVYNACDGIPQCADGSDEAPELGCPAVTVTAAPARPEPRTTPPAPPQPVYPVQMYESEAAAEASADAVAMAGGGGGGERWPHRLLQAQPRRYPGQESGSGVSSHIFSHKGGLVQEEPQLPAFEPPPAQAQPWPRRPAWASHQGAAVGLENSGWGAWGRDWPDERRAWPAAPQLAPQPQPREPELPAYMSGKTMPELPEMPVLYDGQRSMHDAPKKGLGLNNPALPAAPPAPAARPADNATKKKAAAVESETKGSSSSISSAAHVPPAATAQSPAHAGSGAGAGAGAGAGVVVAAEAQRDQHDGLSEHPPAAVMLLVLGVLMTGAMGVLVGCRARATRRRLRRGGKSLAHDADYLVNGMYL